MATKDKKLMDVAKPADAKTDIGSKPMIVGHKPMIDPMVKEAGTEQPKMNNEETQTEAPSDSPPEPASLPISKKKIVPMGEQAESNDSAVESDMPESEQQAEEKSIEVPASVNSSETEKEAESNPKGEDVKNDKSRSAQNTINEKEKNTTGEEKTPAKLDPAAEKMEQEEALRKIIESKKYHVSIKQARRSQKGLAWLFVALLAGMLLALFILIDTGRLDLGFKLPFTVFGQNTTEDSSLVVNTAVDQPQNVNTQPAALENDRFILNDFGFSIPIIDGWQYKDTSVYIEDEPYTLGFEIASDTAVKLKGYMRDGLGGLCEPRSTDSPHNFDNVCPTYEEIERIDVNAGSLYKVKYTSIKTQTEPASTTYLYCFRQKADAGTATDQAEPSMGAVYECASNDIYLTFEGIDTASLAFYEDETVKKFEELFKEIKLNTQR